MGETCETCTWCGVVGIAIFAFVGLLMLDMALDFPIWGRISSWMKHWLDKLPRPRN